MNPAPYLFFWLAGLASQKCMWPSTTKYFSPSFSYMPTSRHSLPGVRLRGDTLPTLGCLGWTGPGGRGLRDEDAAAPQAAGVEVVHGVVDGVEGIALGVQLDLALGG